MKISDLQLQQKKDEYIDYLLKNSVIPTGNIISKYLNNVSSENELGTPLFNVFNIKKNEQSNSKMWNNNFKNLETDINLLYKSFKHVNDSLLNCEEIYLNEKESIFEKIKMINLMVDNVRESLKASDDLYSHCQIFNSFYTCDLNGDKDRGIPMNTSFIDLITNTVKNNKVTAHNSKVDLSGSNIEVITEYNPKTQIGTIDSILTDELNNFCFLEYDSQNVNDKFEVVINLNLKIPKYISSIMLECISFTPYVANLEIASSDNKFKNVYSITSNAICEWMFEKQKVSSIRLTITKNASDGIDGNTKKYYYLFKNLSFVDDLYELSSTYISNPITLNSLIDNVTLNSNDYTLPGTRIDYFVGLDNGKDIIQWKQVYNNQEANIGLFNHKTKILNDALLEYGEYVDDGCYKLFNLPKNYSKNDMVLVPGYQMWKLETLNIPDGQDTIEYEPSIEDYTDYYVQRTCLVDTEEYKFAIRYCKTHMLSQHVYCDKEHYVINKKVTATNTSGGTLKHKLYVNNMQVQSIDGSYNFTLKKGHNSIHLLLYVTNSTSQGFADISHNFNFKENTLKVFAAKPMRSINSKDLRFKGLNNNDKFFSLENDSILIKEDLNMINEHIVFPNMVSDINYKNKSRYYLKYKTLNKNKKYLVDVNGNKTTLRVLANLISNNSSYSPLIENFRVVTR